MQNYEAGEDEYIYLQYGLTVQVNWELMVRRWAVKQNCWALKRKDIDATKQSP